MCVHVFDEQLGMCVLCELCWFAICSNQYCSSFDSCEMVLTDKQHIQKDSGLSVCVCVCVFINVFFYLRLPVKWFNRSSHFTSANHGLDYLL